MSASVAKTVVAVIVAGLLSGSAMAEVSAIKIEQKVRSYSVGLGVSRIIYNPASSGSVVSVKNPNDYPVLVQSKVLTEDRKQNAPFVITPPLFRLDSHQQSRIRIVQTGGEFAGDRETLQWMCATGIPPESDSAWAEGNGKKSKAVLDVAVRLSNCIKLLVRPSSVKGNMLDGMSSLVWKRHGKTLTVQNPTPFYMNFKSIIVGGQNINDPEYAPPFASRSFSLSSDISGDVRWRVITDYGGDSREYQSHLQ